MFTDTEVNNCFSIYHTDTEKLNSRRAILPHRLLGIENYSLFASELANKRTRKALLTCVVYTYNK